MKVEKCLKNIGISPKVFGFWYAKTMIERAMHNEKNILKNLMDYAAVRYFVSRRAIEQGLRTACAYINERAPNAEVQKVFRWSIRRNRKVTPKELITTVAQYCKGTQNEMD